VLGRVSVEADVVERDHGDTSAGVEGVPTDKVIDAMARFHAIERR